MPYWLETDQFGDDPRWEVLAGGKIALVDALQAAYCRMMARASHLLTDGYLTEQKALSECHGRRAVLLRLTQRVLDLPPYLHRPGDECDCLTADWVDGYAYRIHNYLKRNPSRSEYNRNRAQKADLRDPALKARVYARDAGCCRYCRSGPLSPKAGRSRDRRKVLSYDHVDPDAPAGPDGVNLVVACGACNEHKGHRTPTEADMTLLPEPTDAERAGWTARGLALFDRPEQIPDQARITDETATEQQHDADRTTGAVTVPISGPDGDPDDIPSGALRPEHGRSAAETPPTTAAEGDGSGRVGSPAVSASGPARQALEQPARDPAHPDIYHRRSRASPSLYDGWPAGAVPADPRPPQSAEESHHARDP